MGCFRGARFRARAARDTALVSASSSSRHLFSPSLVYCSIRAEETMPSTAQIKQIFERNSKALRLRPSVGRGTARTTVTLRDGLTCDVDDDRWKLVVDMT